MNERQKYDGAMYRIHDSIQKIDSRYDGDYDLIAGSPDVTWADYEILKIVKNLIDIVAIMQKELDFLENNDGKL